MEKFSYKLFNDPVHGSICVPDLCMAVIDTVQFQRLRSIKQLGLVSYVYPGATHTRFEHSIGVCHLAGEFAKSLREKQSELCIDERDILCVQIAGLCHDLGHGPFSHFWEQFLRRVYPNLKWKHEINSVLMFRHLLKKNNLKEKFEFYFGADYERYLTLIEEQIGGSSESRIINPWVVDSIDKSYLYEIVANKHTGIDVDKFDYLARDSHYMGLQNAFDHRHLLHFARVCTVENQQHICFRDKESSYLDDMYRSRRNQHRIGYQHRVVKGLEALLMDLLLAADKFIKVTGSKGKMCLSESYQDMEAFSLLTDDILCLIQCGDDPNLDEAKRLLHLIKTRNIYTFVGKTDIDTSLVTRKNCDKYVEEIWHLLEMEDKLTLTIDDIALNFQVINNGIDIQNPLNGLFFYSKNDPMVGRQLNGNQIRNLQLDNFQENYLLCFCKRYGANKAVGQAFNQWCNRRIP